MPEAVTFRLTTHYKRPRGEPGLTSISSRRLDVVGAFNWLLDEIPGEAVEITESPPGETGGFTTVRIDWSKVPDCIKNPQLPRARR